jgi:hypothetical protein
VREEIGDVLTVHGRADRQDGAEGLSPQCEIVDGSDDLGLECLKVLEVRARGIVVNETGDLGQVAGAVERFEDAESLAAEPPGSNDKERGSHAISLRCRSPVC